MASSSKWRINVTATVTGAAWVSLAEVEMRATAGGADQCNGGVASASGSTATSGNAFDNSTATIWQSGSPAPHWIEYDFPSAVTVAEVAITSTGTAGDAPSAFQIQAWDAASGTWQTAKAYSGVGWTANQTQLFSSAVPPENDISKAGFAAAVRPSPAHRITKAGIAAVMRTSSRHEISKVGAVVVFRTSGLSRRRQIIVN